LRAERGRGDDRQTAKDRLSEIELKFHEFPPRADSKEKQRRGQDEIPLRPRPCYKFKKIQRTNLRA
jgi:hypothetical protein